MGRVIIVSDERMGKGDQELTIRLMGNFLMTLIDSMNKPDFIIFYTSGVKLITEGSPFLETLVSLENLGVKILSCSTCLNYYGIADKVKVGEKSNMVEIVDILLKSTQTISI